MLLRKGYFSHTLCTKFKVLKSATIDVKCNCKMTRLLFKLIKNILGSINKLRRQARGRGVIQMPMLLHKLM